MTEGGGGGAVFVRGGRVKIVNAHFTGNRCDASGPDLGGAAVRVLSQYHGLPVYVVRSTFGKGVCSNGGALSSIGVSWTVLDSVFRDNSAIGRGANPRSPARPAAAAAARSTTTATDDAAHRGLDHRAQPRHRGRERGLLREQRPHGHAADRELDAAANRGDRFGTAGFPGIFYLGATAAPILVGPRPTR